LGRAWDSFEPWERLLGRRARGDQDLDPISDGGPSSPRTPCPFPAGGVGPRDTQFIQQIKPNSAEGSWFRVQTPREASQSGISSARCAAGALGWGWGRTGPPAEGDGEGKNLSLLCFVLQPKTPDQPPREIRERADLIFASALPPCGRDGCSQPRRVGRTNPPGLLCPADEIPSAREPAGARTE